jgi:D-alanyl-D-alanine carboxypeptidase/D-alanyl-D-alanine-endopeptidase (penicillin-binding protein 4)
MSSLGTISVTANVPFGGGAEAQAGKGAALQPISFQPVVLAEHESLPLGEDLRVINKVSQNLHAEMLLRILGREKGTSASILGGLEVMRGFLSLADVRPEEYVFYDGSGLSRENLVTPRATVKLLRYAAKQSWGADFTASLSVAGVDGTLKSRFRTLPLGAQVQAKTGALDHVNSISGYLTTARGDRLVFSIMSNNLTLTSKNASDVLDEIVVEAERVKN